MMFNGNLIHKTIYYCMTDKGVRLSLRVSCESVYRVFYGKHEVCNTLNREDAENLYDLTKKGYKNYKFFGRGFKNERI